MGRAKTLAIQSAYLCAGFAGFAIGLASGEWLFAMLVWGGVALGRFLLERRSWHLPNWASQLLAIPIGLFTYVEFAVWGRPLMVALLHCLALLQIAKIVKLKTAGDLWTMFVISLLMMLVAALICFDIVFMLVAASWSLAAMFFLNAVLLIPSRPGPFVAIAGRRASLQTRILQQSLTTWIAIALGMLVVFFFLPRDLRGLREDLGVRTGADTAAWRTGLMPPPNRGDSLSGFTATVEIGSLGRIIQDHSVALKLQLQQRGLPVHKPDDEVYLAGQKLTLFDGRTWSQNESLKVPQRGERIFARVTRVGERWPGQFLVGPIVDGAAIRQTGATDTAWCWWRHWEGWKLSSSHNAGLQFLALPDTISVPRYRALAETITSGATNDFDRARLIEEYLSTKFTYTLDMEWETNGDPLAEFLFVRRRGYCVYFATAMAILLRSLPKPIPCALCVGYARPQWDEAAKEYAFLKRDAHAWVEVYFAGAAGRPIGVTFDPTASQREAGSARRSETPGWLARWRQKLEEPLLNYDARRQREIVLSLWNAARWMATTIPGILLLAAGLSLIAAIARWRAKQRKAVQQKVLATLTGGLPIPTRPGIGFYVDLLRLLERRGFRRAIAQTPEELARAAASDAATRVTEAYLRVRYAGIGLTPGELDSVQHDLQSLRV